MSAKKKETKRKAQKWITAYKGFKPDMTCRGYQYEEGKEYKTDRAEICEAGFHACEHPLDVFGYYEPSESVFHEVKVGGVIVKSEDGDKIAGTKIKIGARLDIARMCKAAVDFVFARAKKAKGRTATGWRGAASATGGQGAASATGWRGAASATGWHGAASATGLQGAASATGLQGAASATGWRGAASATGEQGAASATGLQGAASATGWRGAASATGEQGAASAGNETAVAVAWGVESKARGVLGAHLVFADWRGVGGEWVLHGAQVVRVDGEKIKPDVFYTVRNGEIVPFED